MKALQLGDLVRLEGLEKPDERPLGILPAKIANLDVVAGKMEDDQKVTVDEMTQAFGDLAKGMGALQVDFFGDKLSWEEYQAIQNEDAKICQEIMSGRIRVAENIYMCDLSYLPLKVAKKLNEFYFAQLILDELRGLSMVALKQLAEGKMDHLSLPATVLNVEKARFIAKNWKSVSLTKSKGMALDVLEELLEMGYLDILTDEIDLDTAKVLSGHKGNLNLCSVETIDSKIAAELGKHEGRLNLGVHNIDAEMAGLLAGNKGELFLRNLRDLDKESAAGLARHSGSELRLGMRELGSVEVAAELVKHQGGLVLENLFSGTLPDEVAMVLATGHDLYAGGNADDKVEKFRKKK